MIQTHIRIIGAGSLGLLVAAKLAAASANVSLLTRRKEQADRLNAYGMVLWEDEAGYRLKLSAHSVTDSAGTHSLPCDSPDNDWVLLMLKQTHITNETAHFVQEQLGARGKLLCFQNGIGHADYLAQFIEAERIFVAVTTEGANKRNDTEVVHTGMGSTWIGSAFPHLSTNLDDIDEKKLVDLLNRAGLRTFLSKKVDIFVWRKLLINCVINPLTAIWKIKNGELLQSVERIQWMRMLFDEGMTVAQAEGIELPSDIWEQLLEVCNKTAENQSSMLQDVLAGKVTEIDWINGGLLSLAQTHGMELPTHRTVCRIVKSMDG